MERLTDPKWRIYDGQDPEARAQLNHLIEKDDVRSVIEVGSFMGGSAEMFASNPRIETVYCVDPFSATLSGNVQDEFGVPIPNWPMSHGVPNPWYLVFVENLRELGLWHKIVPVTLLSVGAAGFVPRADMVYIDGDHSYLGCLADVCVYRDKALKVICGDDYHYRSPVVPDGHTVSEPAVACPNSNHDACGCVPCYPGVVQAVTETFPNHQHNRRLWWVEL